MWESAPGVFARGGLALAHHPDGALVAAPAEFDAPWIGRPAQSQLPVLLTLSGLPIVEDLARLEVKVADAPAKVEAMEAAGPGLTKLRITLPDLADGDHPLQVSFDGNLLPGTFAGARAPLTRGNSRGARLVSWDEAEHSSMDPVHLLATTLGLGFAAGLRLYATILAMGLAIRFGALHLPASMNGLEVLAHPAVLIAAGVAYAIEFISDKIPWVDSLWDSIHTIIRPGGSGDSGGYRVRPGGPGVARDSGDPVRRHGVCQATRPRLPHGWP